MDIDDLFVARLNLRTMMLLRLEAPFFLVATSSQDSQKSGKGTCFKLLKLLNHKTYYFNEGL
ncbi:MAG: hypothetical protein VR64_16675 [Desulfatitalea sp. BRH_c12]|nr:MAG: hypothetical protein VR64_16675 [Desulfatitalea sp. BRH_c12]